MVVYMLAHLPYVRSEVCCSSSGSRNFVKLGPKQGLEADSRAVIITAAYQARVSKYTR